MQPAMSICAGRQRLPNEHASVPLLPAIGRTDEHFQMSNPVRVLTSGIERLASRTFYASGKWRMVERVAWWHDYQEEPAVIFGHYWRWSSREAQRLFSRGEPDLFQRAGCKRLARPPHQCLLRGFLRRRALPGTSAGTRQHGIWADWLPSAGRNANWYSTMVNA